MLSPQRVESGIRRPGDKQAFKVSIGVALTASRLASSIQGALIVGGARLKPHAEPQPGGDVRLMVVF